MNKTSKIKFASFFFKIKTTSCAGVNRKAFSYAHRQKFSSMIKLVFADTKLNKGENFCNGRK